MKHLLQKLTETAGPAGREDAVRELIRREVEPFAEGVSVRALGNLIVHRAAAPGARKGRRILITANMDEVGLVASHIEAGGLIRFAALGEIPRGGLAGARVRFLDGRRGVIGCDRSVKGDALPGFDKFFIDVGAVSPQDCPVTVGDMAVFDTPFLDLGGRVAGKALDNRAGVLAAIETLRQTGASPHELTFVFTAHGQVNMHGAATAANSLEPEIAIALDVTPAGDTPGGPRTEVALGGGPAVKVRDSGLAADPRLVEWFVRTAERKHLPFVREVSGSGASEAASIQISGAGALAGTLAVPIRYQHSPSEVIAMEDLANTVRLLTALLRAPVDP